MSNPVSNYRLRQGKISRVVRTDGSVENDWLILYETVDRVIVAKKIDGETYLKAPSVQLYNAWQDGSNARTTEELVGE